MGIEKGLQKLKWYYQVLIVSVVCAGLLALLWYQYLAPIQADIDSKNAQLADLKRVIAKSLEQQKILAQIKMDCEELQAKLDKLKAVLPTAKETVPSWPERYFLQAAMSFVLASAEASFSEK